MSFVRDDLTAICARLTATLREIEAKISPIDSMSDVGDHASLSDATMAAHKMRYAAHFQGQMHPGASAAL